MGTEICGYIAKLPRQDVPSVSKQESGPASGAAKLPGRILQTFTRGELYIERLHNVFSSRGDRDQVELLFAWSGTDALGTIANDQTIDVLITGQIFITQSDTNK